MKLKNKKTGEIVEVESIGHAKSLKEKFGYQVTLSWKVDEHLDTCKTYNSLAELNEEWEDYEEPKTCWYLDCNGEPTEKSEIANYYNPAMIGIGNYFETREEAEKAVEKLKSWKRLKDKGFRFAGWYSSGDTTNTIRIYAEFLDDELGPIVGRDLALLFGGEE